MNTKQMTITPELARRWLGNNPTNRKISQARVDQYARSMTASQWQANGEAIKLDVDGALLDGQHRLAACIKAGVSFDSLVISSLPREVFVTLDTGAKRSHADLLSIQGTKHAAAVAGAIRWVVAYRKGLLATGKGIKLHATEVIQFVETNPDLIVSVNRAYPASKVLAPSLGGALHYLFSEKDREAADRFFADLANGANLAETDAVLALRKKLLTARSSRYKPAISEVFSWCIRSWDRRRKDLETKLIKGTIRRTEEGETMFPTIN